MRIRQDSWSVRARSVQEFLGCLLHYLDSQFENFTAPHLQEVKTIINGLWSSWVGRAATGHV